MIASSGAGKVEHFSEVFEKTDVEAALAVGIFHREEVPIEAVEEHMRERRRTLIYAGTILGEGYTVYYYTRKFCKRILQPQLISATRSSRFLVVV